MKRENLITMATIVCMVTISIFAAKPSAGETAVNLSPVPTPSPRTKRPKTIQSPKTNKSQRPIRTPNAGTNPSKVIRDGKLTDNERSQMTTPSPTAFKAVGGSSMETEKTAKPKGKSPTSSGDQPEMQINSTQNTRKVKKPKNQDIEVENDETHLTNNPAYRGGGVNNTTHVNRTTPATPGLISNDTVDKIELIKAPRKTPIASPCPSVTTNAKSPNSGRSSTKAKNKNCQEFEAVRPNSPQTPNAAMYNPKELSVDKVVKKKPSKTKRP